MRRFVLALLAAAATFASANAAPLHVQTVPGERIAAIADRIAGTLVSGPDRSLTPAFKIFDQTVPAGTIAIATGTPQVTASYVAVPVTIDVDGKIARTLVAGYRVTTYVVTAVAAHDLAPGTILGPDDLVAARLPAYGHPGTDTAALVGRQLHTTVARGAVVYVEQTGLPQLVRAGQPALLIVHDGPVALSADVIARTGGALGESVSVWDPQTQRALSGVVTGPNVVELVLPGSTE
jgi:flagella basal body P-ring formation protein FlgA